MPLESTQYDPIAVEQFTQDLIHVYQGMGLGMLERTKSFRGVVGKQINVDLLDDTVMGRKDSAPGTPIQTVTDDASRVQITLDNYAGGRWTDIFKDTEVLPDMRMHLASNLMAAINRRRDQILIDHFETESAVVGSKIWKNDGLETRIAQANTINAKLVLDVATWFDDQEVPMEGRHMAIGARTKMDLMDDDKVVNRDYTSTEKWDNGMLRALLGFQIHYIGRRKEGGLPKVNAKPVALFWQESAVGTAHSLMPSVELSYDPPSLSHLVTGHFRCGIGTVQGIGMGYATFSA